MTVVVVPQVTCDLPLHPISFDLKWNHLSNLQLADPTFWKDWHPVCQCVASRPAVRTSWLSCCFQTEFGWVLTGKTESCTPADLITTYHTSLVSGHDILCKFCEIKEKLMSDSVLSWEECIIVHHFRDNHSRTDIGRFVVPLPKKLDAKVIRQYKLQAVRQFLSLEYSLHAKNQFVMGHAEPVLPSDLEKPQHQVFYLPMHHRSQGLEQHHKIKAVFDASAKSSSCVSLYDTLLVGPTIHPLLLISCSGSDYTV